MLYCRLWSGLTSAAATPSASALRTSGVTPPSDVWGRLRAERLIAGQVPRLRAALSDLGKCGQQLSALIASGVAFD